MHVILIAFQLCFLVLLSFFFEKLGLTDLPQKAVNVQFWEYHDCSILHSLQYTQLDRICVLRVCSILFIYLLLRQMAAHIKYKNQYTKNTQYTV